MADLGENMLGEFGAVRDDLVSILALAYGGDLAKGEEKVSGLEALIRGEAKKGALEATPQIRMEVKQEITPYVYIALGLGVLGLLLGAGALIYVRRKHR